LSPPTWQFFADFGSFVLHVILVLFGSFGLRVIICALRWGIYCPLQLGWCIFFVPSNSPLQLGNFLAIFGSFVSRVIFCALRFRVFIVPSNSLLQLGNFLAIFGSLVLCVIICALQFCGVTCVLHAALAACVCCSILSISRMMCGVRNSLRMFW
jgi:hypothetical protein